MRPVTSHARAHFQKVTAAIQAEKSANKDVHANSRTAYERMLMQLDTDKQSLSNMQSIEARTTAKAKLIAQYNDYLAGVLSAEKSAQDDVVVTMMMWQFDIGNIYEAQKLGAFATDNQMAMPEQFKRTLSCVIAEETAEYCLKHTEVPADERLTWCNNAELCTSNYDMPDQARAKLYKAKGFAERDLEKYEDAKAALTRAIELDDSCGVKGELKAIDKKIKELAEAKS